MITIIKSVFGKANDMIKDKPVQQSVVTRQTSGLISIKGKLKNSAKLKDELHSLSMFQGIEQQGEIVLAMIVESTDSKKNPYLFIKFRFTQDGIEADYSIPPEVPNPSVRKLQVIKTLFMLSNLLESKGAFLPDHPDLYEKAMESFSLVNAYLNSDFLNMKYQLDKFTSENSVFRNELERLKAEKEGLNHQLMELERKTQVQDERIKKLERMSEGELDHAIVKWVEEHGGKFDCGKFCDTHGIGGQRLDERLDALAKSGVIRFV